MRTDHLISCIVGLVAAGVNLARADDAVHRPHFFEQLHQKKREHRRRVSRGSFRTPMIGRAFLDRCRGILETSRTAGGIGYYVGGGVPLGHGAGRSGGDGTWGWDETGGRHFRRRTILGWSQGRKYQGAPVPIGRMGR